MKMKKIFAVILAILLVGTMLVGCKKDDGAESSATSKTTETQNQNKDASKPNESDSEEPKLVGLSMHFMQDDYAVFLTKAFKEVMDEAGVKYEIADAGGDPQKQLNDINSMIAKKIDVLVVCPMDEKAVKDVCNKAADSNIPVVSITYMPDTKVKTTIQGGDYENGFGAGELLVKRLNGKGKVAVLDISSNLYRVQQRVEGFMDAIEGKDIEIITTQKMVTKDEAMAAAETILTANKDLSGFFCTFGNTLYGAGAALKQMDKKDLVVTGIDAGLSIMNMINEGYITGAAAQFPSDHGKLAAEAAIKILKGESATADVEVPFKVITAENVKEMAKTLWNGEIK